MIRHEDKVALDEITEKDQEKLKCVYVLLFVRARVYEEECNKDGQGTGEIMVRQKE